MHKLLFTPVYKRGPLGPNPFFFFFFFFMGFFVRNFFYIYIHLKTTINQPFLVYRFKMAAKIHFFILRKPSYDQYLKNHFPKGFFFQEKFSQRRIKWMHLHFWNKYFKKIVLFKKWLLKHFCQTPSKFVFMLIHVKRAQPVFFFFFFFFFGLFVFVCLLFVCCFLFVFFVVVFFFTKNI